MRILNWIPIVAACGLAIGFAPQQSRKAYIEGRVVDAAGSGLADISISTKWNMRNGKLVPYRPFETSADGVFEGKIKLSRKGAVLIAYDAQRELAGFVTLKKGETDAISIELSPVVDFDVRFACSELDAEGCNGMFNLSLGSHPFLRGLQVQGGLRLPLPAGSYEWSAYDSYYTETAGKFTLEPGTEKATEIVDFPASFIQKNIGKVLPDWSVSASRNTDVDLPQISDYRGKWTLVEFWGYW